MQNMTPQEVKDAKQRERDEDAYNKSLRMTEMAPKKDPRDKVRGQRSYAKGGVTRADGCVTKGHTKGKMI